MDTDRRRHPRQPAERLCKIYDPLSRRYAAGRTRNISRGGALVTIQWARRLCVGDPVDLVIAWSPRPVLPADAMVRTRVARMVASEGEVQVVALEFDESLDQSLAA
jgi:hypothetical protein